ncbi:MAG: FixH family protein [Myxococcales bacterium]|nr:FixH family protein [Myxococcales bacterium]MBL0198027.1 FixH family protein [Myxococcales bacterium]HQY61256.1 FixH family protein [Polyangiaceae bacterium]
MKNHAPLAPHAVSAPPFAPHARRGAPLGLCWRSAPWIALMALGLAACSAAEPSTGSAGAPLTTVTSQQSKLKLAIYTSPEQPPTRGTIAVRYVITDASGAPVDGLTLTVAPDMPSMGHGTPTTPKVAAKGGGEYVATDVNLFMAGRWDLRTTVRGAVSDEAIVPVDVR